MCIKELSPDQRPYYYKTSNLEICTKKVCFGSVSDWSSAGFLASHWLKVRAKPNLLGTNFKIGSLIISSFGTAKDGIIRWLLFNS